MFITRNLELYYCRIYQNWGFCIFGNFSSTKVDCNMQQLLGQLKFIYSEKATKFCEIFPLLLTAFTAVKKKGKISPNYVAFSEYMNFILNIDMIFDWTYNLL